MGTEAGPWRVFISHTSELRDFPAGESYVAGVERAIAAAGHAVVDMRDFPAEDQVPAQECVDRVRGCDVYVGVLGTRYGSPVRDRTEVSYSELEFETATNAELPRLMFLLDTDVADVRIPAARLIDREYGVRQDAFRQRVRDSGLTTKSFSSPADLGQLVERSLRALADTRRRVSSGVVRERVPAEPQPVRASKFINPPPATAPTWFQDRQVETGLLAQHLFDPGIRLVTVVGRGGVGKTAMVCRLLKSLEAGRLPDVKGKRASVAVGGIVYLSSNSVHRVEYPTLVADLLRLLPAEEARRLDRIYQDPNNSPAAVMLAMLEAFPPGDPVVVLLDDLESVMDSEHETLREPALHEALATLLTAPAHCVSVLATTRVTPAAVLRIAPAAQRQLPLDKGLASEDARTVLRELDDDGHLGLRDAPDELLDRLCEHTRGFPLALEAVKAILDTDPALTPGDLLDRTRDLPEDQVVEELVGEAYRLLDPAAQQVMQALSVFPVPVSAGGVDYLLQPVNPTINAAPILTRLLRRQLVQFSDGDYHLHPVDRDYARSRLARGSSGDTAAAFTLHGLWTRAADYFATIRTERESWRTLAGEPSEFSDDLAGDLTADLVKPDEGIPADRDHLNMSTYVGMFASVIAHQKTPLPLSIGLFGAWGSGKSYFMGLLRDRVQTLARSQNPDYYHDIVQIGFNAWSYADSNLWASLGDEIFRKLAGPAETDDDERAAALSKDLQDTLERATELKAAKQKAEDQAAQLQADLAAARNDYSNSLRALVKATAQTSASSALGEAWSRLGVTDQAKQIEILLNETQGVRTHAADLRRAVGRRWVFLLGVLGVIGVGLLLAAMWADEARAWLSSAGLTTLLAGAVFVTTAVRKALQTLRTEAAKINARIEQNAGERFAEQVDGVRQANARQQVIQAQLDEVLTRAGELGRELVDINPGQRLYAFLSERAASGDYRGQLGLISTIRKDFQQLSELMQRWRKGPEDKARRPIDRIVLYIDDLDRCSPEQVVDVLQAVHLLLALDLFAVVVGVDPRWLLHSLRHQYQRILAAESATDEADEERLWASTPSDYLEKIFNIPFVLPAMTPNTFKSLIENLATWHADADRAGSGGNLSGSSTADAARPGATGEGSEVETATDELAAATPSVAVAPAATLLHAEVGSEVAAQEAAEGKGMAAPPIPPPRPMTDDELELIYALAPMVGTPREAKRLFNLYRMLRSTRNLSDASRFLGSAEEPGQYQAAAVLLGLLTAYPRLLGEMLWSAKDDKQHLAGGLCERAQDMTWAQFLDSFEPEETDGRWQNAVSSQLSEADRDQWSRLLSAARLSVGLVELPDLSAFRYWADHVARFSFVLSTMGAAQSSTDHGRE